jgi:hypothetical protein
MSGVDRFNQRADLALAKQGVLTDKELLSIDDLRDAWNAQSDAFNSWDDLGIDEIIWFAQQQALARWSRPAIKPVPVAERLPGPEDVDWLDICKGMLHDFDDLVANSDGVLGLHRNGDLATWDELTEGSDFLWTGQFARAREAIDALPIPQPTQPPITP